MTLKKWLWPSCRLDPDLGIDSRASADLVDGQPTVPVAQWKTPSGAFVYYFDIACELFLLAPSPEHNFQIKFQHNEGVKSHKHENTQAWLNKSQTDLHKRLNQTLSTVPFPRYNTLKANRLPSLVQGSTRHCDSDSETVGVFEVGDTKHSRYG
eukprot:m.83577 g.83577  ORF g.83577 m.83577 type:complete len:153 (-) comp12724_c2_seq2:1544-2002(-)